MSTTPHMMAQAKLTPPASPLPHRAKLTTQPRPRWFISRGNGVLVPLIAVDELPHGFELDGAPKTMSMDSVRGMECLGEYLAPAGRYIWTTSPAVMHETSSSRATSGSLPIRTRQDLDPAPVENRFQAPDAKVRYTNAAAYTTDTALSSQGPVLDKSLHVRSATPPAPQRRTGSPGRTDNTQAIIDAIVSADPSAAARHGYTKRPVPPSGKEPDEDNKVYCTYWIRTGECDYTQQGCLYKHEMPDLPTLRSIGFRAVPRWWQERNAIKVTPTLRSEAARPPTWMQKRIAAAEESDSDSGSDYDSDPEIQDFPKPLPAVAAARMTSDTQHPAVSPPVRDIRTQPERMELKDSIMIQPDEEHIRRRSAYPTAAVNHVREPNISSPQLINFPALVPSPAPTPDSPPTPPNSRGSAANSHAAPEDSPQPHPAAFRKGLFVPASEHHPVPTASPRRSATPAAAPYSGLAAATTSPPAPHPRPSSQPTHPTPKTTAADIYALLHPTPPSSPQLRTASPQIHRPAAPVTQYKRYAFPEDLLTGNASADEGGPPTRNSPPTHHAAKPAVEALASAVMQQKALAAASRGGLARSRHAAAGPVVQERGRAVPAAARVKAKDGAGKMRQRRPVASDGRIVVGGKV